MWGNVKQWNRNVVSPSLHRHPVQLNSGLLCFLLFSWLIFTFIWVCRELTQLSETPENASLTALVFASSTPWTDFRLSYTNTKGSARGIRFCSCNQGEYGVVRALPWMGLGCLEASALETSGWKGTAAGIQLILPRQSGGGGLHFDLQVGELSYCYRKQSICVWGRQGSRKEEEERTWSSLHSTATGLPPLKGQGINVT